MATLKRTGYVRREYAEQKSKGIESFPLMLNVDDVAEILRISRAGAYNFINAENELPKVKIGRRVLVVKDDLMQFIQQRKTAAQ